MNFFGVVLHEPTTAITDFILAGMSFYFGHMLYWKKLEKGNSFNRRYSQFWGITFLFLGFASLLGAISHGLPHLRAQYTMIDRAWPFTVMCMGMASFYLFLSIAMEYFPRQRNILFLVAYFKVMAFLLLMFGYPKKYFGEFKDVSFNLVILDYAPVMILLLIMNARDYFKNKSEAAKKIALGVVISMIGTLIQMSGFSLHQDFNHNDIYHVIQMVAITLMYQGVKLKVIP